MTVAAELARLQETTAASHRNRERHRRHQNRGGRNRHHRHHRHRRLKMPIQTRIFRVTVG